MQQPPMLVVATTRKLTKKLPGNYLVFPVHIVYGYAAGQLRQNHTAAPDIELKSYQGILKNIAVCYCFAAFGFNDVGIS